MSTPLGAKKLDYLSHLKSVWALWPDFTSQRSSSYLEQGKVIKLVT
jgi:hypothetical protein